MEHWIQFWFAPTRALDLGVCRFVFFGFILLNCKRGEFSGWSKVSLVFWMPHPFFRRLGLRPMRYEVVRGMETCWMLSLAMACAGLLTPVAVAVSFVLGFYLLGLPNCFGKIRHNTGMLVVIMGILTFSRCGGAFSLDRLLFHGGEPLPVGAAYTWPIRMVWLVFSMAMFGAGFSKVRRSGIRWASGTNLSNILREVHYWRPYQDPALNWGLHAADHKWLCLLLGSGALVIETGYPITLFWPESRWFFVPGAALMFLSFRLFLGPPYVPFVMVQCFWIPWSRLAP